MKLVILRTDIKTHQKVEAISPLFDNHPIISDWSVDTEDIDNVLRIEALDDLNEEDLLQMISNYGFYCEALPD